MKDEIYFNIYKYLNVIKDPLVEKYKTYVNGILCDKYIWNSFGTVALGK